MKRAFNGLDTILGNGPGPAVEAFANESGASSRREPDRIASDAVLAARAQLTQHMESAAPEEASEPDGAEELDGWLANPVSEIRAGEGEDLPLRPSVPAEAADPLLELDRGVYDESARRAAGDDASIEDGAGSRTADLTLEAFSDHLLQLDRGVFDPRARPGPDPLLIPATNRPPRPAARAADNHEQHAAPEQPQRTQTSGWLAVFVVIGGMVLGGSAALAVFHERVSQIVGQWSTRPDPRTSQAVGSPRVQKGSF